MAYFAKGFTLDNDGTTFEMAVDGSTAKQFEVHCPDKVTLLLDSLEMTIVDNAIRPGRFLGETGALTNGIAIQIRDADENVLADFPAATIGDNIKVTEDLTAALFTDFTYYDTPGGSTDDMLLLHAHTSEQAPKTQPRLHPGEKIVVRIQDNITGVTSIRAKVEGHTRPHGGRTA